MKQIPFNTFDGGIIDEDVPGQNNRYAVADNLLIDHSKKLVSRDGFDIFSSTAYQLTASERVARLHSFDADSELLAFQTKKAMYQSTPNTGPWVEAAGPAGGHAFNTATSAHLVEAAEWQKHLFLSSNAGDPVIKMYRDSGSVMRLRTAGLPEFPTTIQSDNDGGLARAITLANDLRTKMIAHFGCNAATQGSPSSSATGHHAPHADLAAQAVAVTASIAATDLPSLIALLNILRTQYTSHLTDAQKEDPSRAGYSPASSFRNYHAAGAAGGEPFYIYMVAAGTGTTAEYNQPQFQWRHFLNFTLADISYTVPGGAAIADVLKYLNDLRDKWNWHTYATKTHLNAMVWKASTNSYYGTHATALARVETYTWANITPNYGAFIQYVKDLYTELYNHLYSGMHMDLADATNDVDAAFPKSPTTFWDAVCLLGAVADGWSYHALEADIAFGWSPGAAPASFASATASTTSGSKSITWSPGGTLDQWKNWFVAPVIGTLPSTPFAWSLPDTNQTFISGVNYNVDGSTNATPTTLTAHSNMLHTNSGVQMVLTTARHHIGLYSTTTSIFAPRAFAASLDALDFTLGSAVSLQAFADLAKSLADAMKLHQVGRMTPSSVYKLKFNGKSFDNYNQDQTFQAYGYNYALHYYPDATNYPNQNIFPIASMFTTNVWDQSRFTLAPLAASFNYQACFRYDYTVGAKRFTDRSAPSASINVLCFINEDNSDGGSTEKGKYAATITNLYQYANAANENFDIVDTTKFRKEIYRTVGDGSAFFRCDIDGVAGDVSNATASFSDYTSDTWLPDQLGLYTNGGAPENNRPPAASGIHIFDNVAYYVVGNRVYQSIPADPDSVPGDFYEEFPEDLMGVSSTKTVAVAFGRGAVYRLVGGFDDLGRGSLTYERIFNRSGAVSSQSIVKADDGIFFAGKDGFYFTDGYQCVRVTDLVNLFVGYTNTAAKQLAIQGAYDRVNKKLIYTMTVGNGSTPDKLWVIDIKFGIKPDATPVTTWSKTSGFNPTAVAFYGDAFHYADADGYVFKQALNLGFDLVKNTGVAATLWPAETIIWDFKSCHDPYGTEGIRKYFTRLACQFDMQGTNVSCQVLSDADKGRKISVLPVIRSRKLTDWGDSKIDWVASVYPAKPGNMVDSFVWMKGDGSLRSNYRSFEFANAYCVIVASKDMGTVTLANVSGNDWTVTLTSLSATRKWPLYSVGYFVRIAGVDYPVTTRTSDFVVHIDATGLTAPTAGVPASWELWGYPKNERIRFMGYTVNVDAADDMQSASQGPVTTGGRNA